MTPRTEPADRRWSKFGGTNKGTRGQVSVYEAGKELLNELKLLGARDVVITSCLPSRMDGLPYSDGKTGEPGVAVWFMLKGLERSFACDKWRSPGENIHSLSLTIAAMRGISRWGVANAVERAFAGFAALPPGSSGTVPPAPVKRAWREVLGEVGAWPELEADELLVLARSRHRKLIQLHHPDRGGSVDLAAEINVALADAENELEPANGASS